MGRRIVSGLGTGGPALGRSLRPRSSAVYTATTPGDSFAALVSIPVIVPCATPERTNAA
jgi:hypothetical protein